MQIIPLQAVPSQTLNVILGTQNAQLNLYQLSTGLYIDVYVQNALIIGGVICQNANRIVRDLYLGFQGDLVFIDNSGQGNDPYYTGLGATFSLVWLEPSDLPAGVG